MSKFRVHVETEAADGGVPGELETLAVGGVEVGLGVDVGGVFEKGGEVAGNEGNVYLLNQRLFRYGHRILQGERPELDKAGVVDEFLGDVVAAARGDVLEVLLGGDGDEVGVAM